MQYQPQNQSKITKFCREHKELALAASAIGITLSIWLLVSTMHSGVDQPPEHLINAEQPAEPMRR